MKAFFRHWGLVNRHRYHVWVNGIHCGIGWHCFFHDLSKFHPTEFLTSVRHYHGMHSPVYEERLKNDYFSFICQHHTKRNKHHWEYWIDFFQGHLIAMTMPWIYATEYVCDMLSASYCYDPKGFTPEKTLNYFLARCDHYYISSGTKEYIAWCLTRYRDMGFAGLKKKDTKKAYAEITSRHPRVEIFSSLAPVGTLPPRVEEFIMPKSQREKES